MSDQNYRLYAGKNISHYDSFEAAKEAAKKHMIEKAELRIEILTDLSPDKADFWAYEYDTKQWVPS
ncbi:hypothetical protein [Microbulbifer sp. ZKSA002]|uniref:hypothetical protein n=1 Tax=Microbulbifer sp. ZKSA002 TaxID=3243388 RepID=UPI0040397077